MTREDRRDEIDSIHDALIADLMEARHDTPFQFDANETDPRYRGYGVRAPARREIFKAHRPRLKALSIHDQLALADRLIDSGYGEQQELAFLLLRPLVKSFDEAALPQVERWLRQLHGWSKIDGYASAVLQPLLPRFPELLIARARAWSVDPDPWMRRMSVVLFTRKVARSGEFTDVALEVCEALRFDEHEHVLKGVGWLLHDLMDGEPERLGAYVKRLRAEGVSSIVTLYAVKRLKGPQREAILAIRPASKRS